MASWSEKDERTNEDFISGRALDSSAVWRLLHTIDLLWEYWELHPPQFLT